MRYDHRHRSPVLFLKDAERDKYLPVWIGDLEASSIELAANNKRAPRPLTHDLFVIFLNELGASLTRVVIDRLESKTYYATIHIEHNGRSYDIDCRPSDAIALALRENVTIFVDDELMYSIKFVEVNEDEGIIPQIDEDDVASESGEGLDDSTFHDFLKSITPNDFKDNLG